MSKKNHPNNIALRDLIEASGLSQTDALSEFNKGQVRPISLSGWKAWLAAPDSRRWRPLTRIEYVDHAKKTFETQGKTSRSRSS